MLYNGVHVVPMGEDGPSGSVVNHSALLESLRSISCGVKRALKTLLIENARYLDNTPESLLDERVISFTETLVKDPVEIWKADEFERQIQRSPVSPGEVCLHSGANDQITYIATGIIMIPLNGWRRTAGKTASV